MNIKISIITPVYNRQDYIEECIQSVLAQTYGNWEHILVDDGSTDSSKEIIEKYASEDTRIKLFERNRNPKGAPTCRNIGLKVSESDYILFLDSDDILATHCLEQRLLNAQLHSFKFDFLTFPMLIFGNGINTQSANRLVNITTEENDLLRYIKGDNVWAITQLLWKKDFVKKLDGFNENLAGAQDLDLHVRALYKNPIYFNHINDSKPDCFYRQYYDENRISRQKSIKKADAHASIIELFKKHKEVKFEPYWLTSRIWEIIILYCEAKAPDLAMRLIKQNKLHKIDLLVFTIIILCYRFKLNNIRGFPRITKQISIWKRKHILTCKVEYSKVGNITNEKD